MSWIQIIHHCAGTTVRKGSCWSRVPYAGMFCWTHRNQRTKEGR